MSMFLSSLGVQRLTVLAFLAVVGCGPAPPLVCEIGTGDTDFAALADGDQVDLVQGIQGGFHIWIGMRIQNRDLDRAEIALSGSLVDTGAAIGPASRVPVAPMLDAQGRRTIAGLRNFVDMPDAIRGKPVNVVATVEAPDHRTCTDRRRVIPR